MLLYLGSLLRRDVREAEGARLEIVYGVKSSIAGSNPALSAICAPIAQMDRAVDCGSAGQEFESPWAHLILVHWALRVACFPNSVRSGRKQRQEMMCKCCRSA